MVLAPDLFIIKTEQRSHSKPKLPPPPEIPNEKVYGCRICKQRFIRIDFFAIHLKNEHQIIIA